jgi:nitroreductase
MDFSELIRKRYSVRAYRPDPVPEDKLQQVLEAGRLAPTAANRQPFQIIVLRTAGREEELLRVYHREWLVDAPIVLGVCAVASSAWVRMDGKVYADVDATIVMDHLVLAATDLGLGTCWIADFDPQAARQVLRLPDGVEPIAFTPLGYAAAEPGTRVRKPLSDLVRYDHW